jgi:hypothetical protein
MKVKNLFERDIFRPINGVVKADQLDDASVWQELDEFVVTKELDKHFRTFFSSYVDSVNRPNQPETAGKIGIWISGYFGSGKSHLLKVLAYLLRNKTHRYDGNQKAALQFFQDKITDATVFGDIQRSVSEDTDVVLFNIDSKADSSAGRSAILQVFLKVLNEMLGYSGDHAHVAHMERYLDSKGKLQSFHLNFRNATGSEWVQERDAYQFHRDDVIKALRQTLDMSQESAEKWIDGAEETFALSIENFAKWVKQYLDSKGDHHRIVFLVDEVGQFIGTDTHLMLNLQTITEELGTVCNGRAWIVVTAQESIDAVLGEIKQSKSNDFSKIQGRFKTRLTLSSANVDEVIQSRLLKKSPDVMDDLRALFESKGDIIRHQLTFNDCSMELKNFRNGDDFCDVYPFVPYQFRLLQQIFESIRKIGATGLHLARGERSLLDAFQSAARQIGLQDIGVLVPLYMFYPSIESFLDTVVKRTIEQAKDNVNLEQPFDIHLLQVLFLIRYIDSFKSTVDNLVTLCIDRIDADRLALRHQIEESLKRLENASLISRNGDVYYFLTNEERDINKEIKNVELTGNEPSRTLGAIIFAEILKNNNKYRYPANRMDFTFNRMCDLIPVGSRSEPALLVSVITPVFDDYDSYEKTRCVFDSGTDGGCILIRLNRNETLEYELNQFIRTEKYVRYKSDGTQSETARRIFSDLSLANAQRYERVKKITEDMLCDADYYANGQKLDLQSSTPAVLLNEALEYLVENTFKKMSYIKHLHSEPEKELQAILRSNDVAQQTIALEKDEANPMALDDVRRYIVLSQDNHKSIILHDLLEKRYAARPYGWPVAETLVVLARLVVLSDISLVMNGRIMSPHEVYENVTRPAQRRKISVIRRIKTDEADIQKARALGRELFMEMGPDGEDTLFDFFRAKLKNWQDDLNRYKPLADTGEYPGKDDINNGIALVNRFLSYEPAYTFFEKLALSRNELLDFAEHYQDLRHFYNHQRTAWDQLGKLYETFALNYLLLEQDAVAGPALKRMREILDAPEPYGLIKESESLIKKVAAVNTELIAGKQNAVLETVKKQIETVHADLVAAQGTEELKIQCLNSLETILQKIQSQKSLAHITQLETEALRRFEQAQDAIQKFVDHTEQVKTPAEPTAQPKERFKKRKVVNISHHLTKPYLETPEDVETFLNKLKRELMNAVEQNQRIKIEH